MPARIAPPTFLEEVQRIDPSLDVEWSDKHERWFITQTSYVSGRKVYLLVVEDEDREYRDLDRRVIVELNRMFFKDPDVQDSVEHMKKNNEKLEAEKERVHSDQIADVHDYTWNLVAGTRVFGLGDTLKNEETTIQ